MTSHFVTLLRKSRVACDDNSSKFSHLYMNSQILKFVIKKLLRNS